jgi:uncharacterized membrane protein
VSDTLDQATANALATGGAGPKQRNVPGPTTGRIEAFSDGVIAIIITIMVLELKPEHTSDTRFWSAFVVPLAPKLISYAMSFLVVAIMWVNHHQLMDTAPSATRPLLWWNNHLLFWMSLIPFATAYVGENPISPIAVAIYGFVLFACASSFARLRRSVAGMGEPDKRLRDLHNRVMRKSLIGAAVYGLSIPLAFISVYLSMAAFLIVPALFFMPDPVPGQAELEGIEKT